LADVSHALEGYRIVPEEDRAKAKRFFESAAAKAGAGQYDYAIELFLGGLNLDPEAVDAHKALRDLSLRRKASGGKSLGMFDKMKIKSSKDDKQNMLNAEKLLAFDPGERSYMADLFQNAIRTGCFDTAMWIGPVLLTANRDHPKSDIRYYFVLRDGYKRLEQWRLAAEATAHAVQMRPEDMDLSREQRDLATLETMKKGAYEEGDFRKSIRDAEGQRRLMEQDMDIRSLDAMTRQILEAERELQADPHEAGKLIKLIDLLVKSDDVEKENHAIELLEEAHKRTRQYRWRLQIHRINMRQLDRIERAMRQEAAGGDPKAIEEYKQFRRDKAERELKMFAEAAEEYPTDQSLKFDQARRLRELARFEEAIPLLQTVRNDPKYRVDATILLGQTFLDAGFADEAADTLSHLSEEYQLRGDPKSLEIFYWWGRALESKQNADVPAALKCYSQVFQWSATYRDVQQRIKKLRAAAQSQ
jgi:tetratricopeptide (TPR) repeat protein